MAGLEFFGATDKGRRASNQDCFLAQTYPGELTVLAVADGMGGARGGEVASALVIEAVAEVASAYEAGRGSADLKQLLESVYDRAQHAIAEQGRQNPELNGMGSTLCCLAIQGNRYAWANIGDSRIYRLQGDGIEQLTVDHTFIQGYLDKHGTISLELAGQYGHYLEKAIDGSGQKPDLFPENRDFLILQEGELFLLCSDGLSTEKVKTNVRLLYNYLVGTENIEESVNKLIEYAFNAGSDDNITVVQAEFGKIPRKALPLHMPDLEESIILPGQTLSKQSNSRAQGGPGGNDNTNAHLKSQKNKRAIRDGLMIIAIILLIALIGMLLADQYNLLGPTDEEMAAPDTETVNDPVIPRRTELNRPEIAHTGVPTGTQTKDSLLSISTQTEPDQTRQGSIQPDPEKSPAIKGNKKAVNERPAISGDQQPADAPSDASANAGATPLYEDISTPNITPPEEVIPLPPAITDSEGNSYKTVRIGDQIWMAEDLRSTKYNDGTPIVHVTKNSSWGDLTNGAYCWYENTEWYKNDYGALYNWYAVESNKLCPAGWKVPDEQDWWRLIIFLGGKKVAGTFLKEDDPRYWRGSSSAMKNLSGFSARGGGFRNEKGFYQVREYGYWWVLNTSDLNNNFVEAFKLVFSDSKVDFTPIRKNTGVSVRCLRE